MHLNAFWKGKDSYSLQSPCMDLCLISLLCWMLKPLLAVALPVLPVSFCRAPPSYHGLPLLMPYALTGFVLSPTPQPSLRARIHEWHFIEPLCPHTGCDTHRMRFSSSFWKSESTFQNDSLKIDNRFSSRKLQGKLNSIYFKKILLKFWFLKSQKTTFLALQVIHILKLCPWGHKMRYFILLMLGNTHRSMNEITHNIVVCLKLWVTWFQKKPKVLYQLVPAKAFQMYCRIVPCGSFLHQILGFTLTDQRARKDIKI